MLTVEQFLVPLAAIAVGVYTLYLSRKSAGAVEIHKRIELLLIEIRDELKKK